MNGKVAITGNTYAVKEALKAMGATWNADKKAWMIAEDKADEARQIVGGAPAANNTARRSHRHGQACDDCGRPGATIPCVDSSGIGGVCCPMCARMSRFERSFA